MNNIVKLFRKNTSIKACFEEIHQKNKLLVSGAFFSHEVLTCVEAFHEFDDTIVYVTSNLYKATLAYEALCEIVGYEQVHLYAVDEVISAEAMATSHEFRLERLHAVQSILENKKKIIVTHICALVRTLMPKKEIEEHKITFSEGEIVHQKELAKKLIESGYKKTPTTTQIGEFSVRGEIIDIYPINTSHPIRIDLFDDEIEYIKTFDEGTQKTIEKLGYIDIYPVNELVYSNPEEIVNKIKKEIRDESLIQSDLEDILSFSVTERLQKYVSYFYSKPEILLDYLNHAILFFDQPMMLKESYEKSVTELENYLQTKPEYKSLHLSFFEDYYRAFDYSFKQIYFLEFKQTLPNLKLDGIIDIHGQQILNYQNNIKHFIADVYTTKKTFVIVFSKEETLNLLKTILDESHKEYHYSFTIDDIQENKVNLMIVDFPMSFGFLEGIEVISEQDIFKKLKYKHAKYRSAYQNTQSIQSKEELKPGDYVVHYDYGIGQYLGIKTVELSGIKNDYLRICFADIELLIPVENIHMIEKYLGSEGSIPKLTTVGSKEWEKKKKKIKEKLKDIARDLIHLQALREQIQGAIYSEDDEIQKSFEDDFEFVETEDQIKAVEEIKKDMEQGRIIDRLVCGDVGYGKTEVAIRIAMKTVLNGKQVAYLAPTTILTRQHYYTFLERFKNYGVHVALLNRLVPQKQQERILEELRNGQIDIVIGTHSLLSDMVQYKNLGLLIVDEEQRFGVMHKEKIKQYKNNVNVLTLTATPIPRTLQMSIMGIRQMSLMETPPQNRYPVQTYVIEENDAIIREAIYRELGRGGQVFYLHNRIQDIDRVALKVHRLVPEARIVVGHGKMSKTQLEDCMQSFIDKEYDVLICTTIIETGIDIPNTNTLIVDMSDRLGLAQMYQIRGRVGRSDRVSYAYFMYPEDKVITKDAQKRLEAIREFTTLGSGYKIAVRDLAIRGAGDILGSEQSGFIDSVGLELYMKLLSESIDEVQGKKKEQQETNHYQVEVSKHVSDQYVSDDDIKIYIHKEIHGIETKDQRQQVITELTDRFGRLTEEIKTYIDKQYMEGLFRKYHVEKIQEYPTYVLIIFKQDATTLLDASKLFMEGYKLSSSFSFEYKNKKIYMKLKKNINNKSWIEEIIQLFEKITS